MEKVGPQKKTMEKAEQKAAEKKKEEEERLQADAAKRRLEFEATRRARASEQPPAFHQTTSLNKRKSLPAPPPRKQAKKSKISGSKGTRPTRAEDLQECYDYVPDLAPDNMPDSNKDERHGDPNYQESDQSESESELDGVNLDDKDQRRYNETELPGFNCNAPRVPPPQSNGDSFIGSNAQAIVIRPSKWWRVVSVKAS
jgi:hypothetical protein